MRTNFFHCELLFITAALLASPSRATEPAHLLRDKTRAALQESLRFSNESCAAVVHRLVDVYDELERTQEVDDREQARLQAQVRARLDRLAGILKRQLAAEAMVGQAVPDNSPNDPKPAADAKQPHNVKSHGNEVLAQRIVAPGRAAGPGVFPAGAFRQAGAGFAANPLGPAQPPDNGQALVDLIQRTIAPASWDINGGPGSIVYFRQPRVLVVRQRSEVHEQLQDVVRQLRQ